MPSSKIAWEEILNVSLSRPQRRARAVRPAMAPAPQRLPLLTRGAAALLLAVAPLSAAVAAEIQSERVNGSKDVAKQLTYETANSRVTSDLEVKDFVVNENNRLSVLNFVNTLQDCGQEIQSEHANGQKNVAKQLSYETADSGAKSNVTKMPAFRLLLKAKIGYPMLVKMYVSTIPDANSFLVSPSSRTYRNEQQSTASATFSDYYKFHREVGKSYNERRSCYGDRKLSRRDRRKQLRKVRKLESRERLVNSMARRSAGEKQDWFQSLRLLAQKIIVKVFTEFVSWMQDSVTIDMVFTEFVSWMRDWVAIAFFAWTLVHFLQVLRLRGELNDGSGPAWEVNDGLSAKQKRQKERKAEEKKMAEAAKVQGVPLGNKLAFVMSRRGGMRMFLNRTFRGVAEDRGSHHRDDHHHDHDGHHHDHDDHDHHAHHHDDQHRPRYGAADRRQAAAAGRLRGSLRMRLQRRWRGARRGLRAS